MTRHIFNVGQGAFYLEHFNDHRDGKAGINVVYDCGSSDKEMLTREIKKFCSNNTVIECLFISHFHDDHINGLMKLKENNIKIKNIILPYLDDVEKCQHIGQMRNSQIDLLNFIVNPKNSRYSDNVLYVKRKGFENTNYYSAIPDIGKDLIDGGKPIEVLKLPHMEDWVEKTRACNPPHQSRIVP